MKRWRGTGGSRKLLQFPCLIKVTLLFVSGGTKPMQYLTGTHTAVWWANSDSWVSWLIDLFIDHQLLNSSSWWTDPAVHYFFCGCPAGLTEQWGPWFSLTGISGFGSKDQAYICSLWLPAPSCFNKTVNGSFSLARWEVMCKRECGHAHANRPYSSLDWLLSVFPRLSVFRDFHWKIMYHCYAHLCKERFGSLSIFFILSTTLYALERKMNPCARDKGQKKWEYGTFWLLFLLKHM